MEEIECEVIEANGVKIRSDLVITIKNGKMMRVDWKSGKGLSERPPRKEG